ncbi:MAG TPA: hypothetical protein VKT70_03870 [Stellaceae bacterium]|nr:hypothetical protein [Stellaceae bacterium]
MKVLVLALFLGSLLGGGLYYFLAQSHYIPLEPLAISRHFLDLLEEGDFERAYLLTDRGRGVGQTPEAFVAKLRHELGIDHFPLDRPIKFIANNGGGQSYGNRLRRWIMGRKLDPDEVSLDYLFGPDPFEIRLASDGKGGWRIIAFQSHAM